MIISETDLSVRELLVYLFAAEEKRCRLAVVSLTTVQCLCVKNFVGCCCCGMLAMLGQAVSISCPSGLWPTPPKKVSTDKLRSDYDYYDD